MKEEILDKIDRYLRKEMTLEETEAFEQELQKDVSLREEVELTKDIIGSLKDRQEKLERMKEWDTHNVEYKDEMAAAEVREGNAIPAYKTAMPRSGSTHRIFSWIAFIGIAACLLVGVFLIHPVYDSTISDVSMSAPPLSNSYRGTFSTHEIQNLITQGKNEQALTLIDSLEENYKMEAMQYHGKDSLTDEEAYELQVNALATYELEWLRIKALIGDKQYEKALSALDKYRMQEGDYQEKADSLWNKVKKRFAK